MLRVVRDKSLRHNVDYHIGIFQIDNLREDLPIFPNEDGARKVFC